MKTVFYKNGRMNKIFINIFGFTFIYILLMGLLFQNLVSIVPILIMIAAVLFVYFIAMMKFAFSKIYISEIGIELRLFKKQLKFISWENIKQIKKKIAKNGDLDIYEKKGIKGIIHLSLELNGGDNFSFNFNEKIKQTIMALCPIEELKKHLEAIKFIY